MLGLGFIESALNHDHHEYHNHHHHHYLFERLVCNKLSLTTRAGGSERGKRGFKHRISVITMLRTHTQRPIFKCKTEKCKPSQNTNTVWYRNVNHCGIWQLDILWTELSQFSKYSKLASSPKSHKS